MSKYSHWMRSKSVVIAAQKLGHELVDGVGELLFVFRRIRRQPVDLNYGRYFGSDNWPLNKVDVFPFRNLLPASSSKYAVLSVEKLLHLNETFQTFRSFPRIFGFARKVRFGSW